MDGEIPDHYFTFEGRLASFEAAQPVSRRKSNAKGKGPKALAWPHKRLDPVNLARAGFYYDPSPQHPDNVVCFLCQKQVADWDEDDIPLDEHLRLSPHCGWAVVSAIEAGVGDYNADDPTHPDMMEARKATFSGRWPHEGRRGWKCKTKQMVDAGWKYTPTLDSEDMATCVYCQLALDGWEPGDKPMNEHYKRSPECPFFTLIDQYQQGPTKKTSRGKGARSSKASRLSIQSVATTATADTASILDNTLDTEDSVLTTTSVMTAGGTKRSRAKKGTTAKGKKTRVKKDEAVQVLEDAPEEPPAPPPKPTRGRKRASDAMENSVLTNAEAPAPKKRAGRVRRSNTVDPSVVEWQHDEQMLDTAPAPPAKTRRKKARASNTRSARTRQASVASTVSTDPLHGDDEGQIPNDDELDRQLEADLDRPLSEDEMIAADSDSETLRVKGKGKKVATKKSAAASQEEAPNDHAMFDPSPPAVDDADVSADLRQLQQDIEAEQVDKLHVAKKGRKAGTRKASKQTKAQKTKDKAAEPTPEPTERELQTGGRVIPSIEDVAPTPEPIEEHDDSMASNATVIRNSAATVPKKRGRPKKNSTQSQASISEVVDEAPAEQKALPPLPTADELQPPSTPGVGISPAPAARQAALSPSQSPQSSDAENQPPSSRPSNSNNTVMTTRVALAPVAATPMRSSPSKRNVHFLSGLQSEHAWTAVDLELILDEFDKENAELGSDLTKSRDLGSPEKRMTVEEWIYHNAGLAEQRLRMECEAMVTKFEREGGKAMQSLEGVTVD